MRTAKWATVVASILVVLTFLAATPKANAGDDLSYERGNFKAILNAAAESVEKNYYDPQLKGLDWKASVEQAKQKIENAKSVSEMMTAIYVVVNKLHDSHTVFLPPGRNVRYRFGLEAKPIGSDIYVYEVKKKLPAEKAGILPGDRVLAVNGFAADRKNFDDMMFAFRVLRNMGELDLVLQRDNEEPRKIHLVAEKRVEGRVLDFVRDGSDIWDLIRDSQNFEEDWYTINYKDGIGYAQLRGFTWEGEDLFTGLIEKSGAKRALILDLRSNGGGYEDTLRKFAGQFTTSPVVLAKVVGRKKTEEIAVKPRKPYYEMPLYILVDSETGSAAEMLARHLQTTRNAVLIGDISSGRVTRSIYMPGSTGSDRIIPFGVQVDVGKVVFPDGGELEGKGVVPDQRCLPSSRDLREEHDLCLWKAVELARTTLGLASDPSMQSATKAIGAHQ
jgi:C-terminal processing protease CtpA/Prc